MSRRHLSSIAPSFRGPLSGLANILQTARLLSAAVALFVIAATSDRCEAALTFTLTPDVDTVSTDGGTVRVSGTVLGSTGDQLQAYDLFITSPGRSLSSGDFTISNQRTTGLTGLTSEELRGDSVFFGGFSLAPLTVDTPIALFAFDVNFANGLTAGDVYQFDFNPADTDFTVSGPLGPMDLSSVTFRGTSVSVSAIPEPTSLGALTFAGVAILAYRRRRTRRTA